MKHRYSTNTTPTAMVFGAFGQDGTYLSKLLLEKKFKVIKIGRSFFQKGEITFCQKDESFNQITSEINTVPIDVAYLLKTFQPEHLYHLAAHHGPRNHLKDTKENRDLMWWLHVELTSQILAAAHNYSPKCKILIPGSSLMYKLGSEDRIIDEFSVQNPQNYYALTKIAAHRVIKRFRRKMDLHVGMPILFNHDSPLKKPGYFSSDLAEQISLCIKNQKNEITLKDPSIRIDLSDARDVVKAFFKIMVIEDASDFIIGSGKLVNGFSLAVQLMENFNLKVNITNSSGEIFNPDEAVSKPALVADPTKAKRVLEWQAEITPIETLMEMINLRLTRG